MYYILIKCYFFLEKFLLLFVPFVDCTTKLKSTFLAVIWIEIKLIFSEYTQLTLFSPQIATFGLLKGNDKFFLIQNMILMVLKLYVYKLRVSDTLNFNTFLHQLVKVKNSEKDAAFNDKQKHDMYLKKWSIIENLLPQQKIFRYLQYEQQLCSRNNFYCNFF